MDGNTTLENNVAIITGAGSGIGRACAAALFARGARLVLVEFNGGTLNSAVEALTAAGGAERVHGMQLDVRREDDMAGMAREVVERFGRIDHLIAAAGILRPGGQLRTVKDMSLEEWRAVIDTNLTGTFLSNRAVLGQMIAQKQGDIINFSSVSGRQGRAFDSAYCATKFGIIGLSESLAEEVTGFGIRVQTVLPDAVDTPLWDQNGPAAMRAPATLPPERVAELVLFLLELPRDTYLLNPVLGAFKGRRQRRKRGMDEK